MRRPRRVRHRWFGAASARRRRARWRPTATASRSATATTPTRAETLAAVEPTAAEALAVQCDVADPASLDAAFTAVETELGKVEILVNNAGSHTRRSGAAHE